jgi:hypothetical protein
VFPSLGEFAPELFELLFQIDTRHARRTNARTRLRFGRTKLATLRLALRALARQGHPPAARRSTRPTDISNIPRQAGRVIYGSAPRRRQGQLRHPGANFRAGSPDWPEEGHDASPGPYADMLMIVIAQLEEQPLHALKTATLPLVRGFFTTNCHNYPTSGGPLLLLFLEDKARGILSKAAFGRKCRTCRRGRQWAARMPSAGAVLQTIRHPFLGSRHALPAPCTRSHTYRQQC